MAALSFAEGGSGADWFPAFQAAEEIDNNVRIFEEASGLPMLLFRVPYGARCKRLDQMLAGNAKAIAQYQGSAAAWCAPSRSRGPR